MIPSSTSSIGRPLRLAYSSLTSRGPSTRAGAREGLALGPTVRGFETLALVRKHQRQPTEAARLLAQALELDASRGGHAQARLRALIAAAQASAATE